MVHRSNRRQFVGAVLGLAASAAGCLSLPDPEPPMDELNFLNMTETRVEAEVQIVDDRTVTRRRSIELPPEKTEREMIPKSVDTVIVDYRGSTYRKSIQFSPPCVRYQDADILISFSDDEVLTSRSCALQ